MALISKLGPKAHSAHSETHLIVSTSMLRFPWSIKSFNIANVFLLPRWEHVGPVQTTTVEPSANVLSVRVTEFDTGGDVVVVVVVVVEASSLSLVPLSLSSATSSEDDGGTIRRRGTRLFRSRPFRVSRQRFAFDDDDDDDDRLKVIDDLPAVCVGRGANAENAVTNVDETEDPTMGAVATTAIADRSISLKNGEEEEEEDAEDRDDDRNADDTIDRLILLAPTPFLPPTRLVVYVSVIIKS